MKKELVAVYIESGEYEDYTKTLVFVTDNFSTADRWVKRYNKIEQQMLENSISFNKNGKKGKQPFGYYLTTYYAPIALLEMVEWRD